MNSSSVITLFFSFCIALLVSCFGPILIVIILCSIVVEVYYWFLAATPYYIILFLFVKRGPERWCPQSWMYRFNNVPVLRSVLAYYFGLLTQVSPLQAPLYVLYSRLSELLYKERSGAFDCKVRLLTRTDLNYIYLIGPIYQYMVNLRHIHG